MIRMMTMMLSDVVLQVPWLLPPCTLFATRTENLLRKQIITVPIVLVMLVNCLAVAFVIIIFTTIVARHMC